MLSMWEDWFGLYKKVLTEMNLMHKVASMRAIDVTPDNRNLLGGKEEKIFPLLLDAAKRCIEEDGADVICLGSTTMHQSAAFLAENLPVPVINPGPLSYKTAEAMMSLDLSQSRKAYPTPKVDKRSMIHAMLDAAVAEQTGKAVEKLD
jgi:allantoin racemase